MPYKHTKFKIPKKLDKRVKITDKDRDKIRELYAAGGTSHRKLAIEFGVSKRLIQFILNPEKHQENLDKRKERGGSKMYFNKDKHTDAMKKHRRYKQELFLEGELI